MYLKAVEIQGFKSFPDKTVLQFGEDITAIVGPNGSGKSNISDAIRWVMGEQSAKGLRGAKMEDVIFGGTEKRAQVGFAQVTLVLDNTARIFPAMEESEVAVTRRYYRSGESEYYINRQSVRLKDVTELFLDTGMGKEGYSIIGQGKIDEILSAKSGERREIFEEAAGISKFRHRKEESERKLQRTEENLVRINDKISELELQVEPLRDQAEKAKKYLVLRDELRLLEISVWLENLDALKASARKLETDFRAAEAQRDQARADLDALYAEGEQFGQRMREKDMEAESLRAQSAALEGQTQEQSSAMAVLESNIRHNRENIGRARQDLVETDSRAGGLARQAMEQEARVAEIERELAELDGALDTLLARAQKAADQAGGAQSEAEAFRAREAIAVAAAADAHAVHAAIEAENTQIAERRAAVEEEKAAAETRLAESGKEAKANRRALEEAREEAQAAANIIAGHSLRMEERKKKAAAAADQRVKLTMDVGAMDNRIRLLTEMEKEYEGFSKAVKTVMQAKGSLRGIHGPVASLMRTEAAYSHRLPEAAGRRAGYLPAPYRHPGRGTGSAGRGAGIWLCGHCLPPGAVPERLSEYCAEPFRQDGNCGRSGLRHRHGPEVPQRLPYCHAGRAGHQPGRLHDRRFHLQVRRRAEPGGGTGKAERPGRRPAGKTLRRQGCRGGGGPGTLRRPVRTGDRRKPTPPGGGRGSPAGGREKPL